MKVPKEQEEIVINCGAFGYDVRKIASVLGQSEIDVQKELNDPRSEMSALIQKGRDMAEYVIDLKLFEMAKSGDIKALEKFEFRKRQRR